MLIITKHQTVYSKLTFVCGYIIPKGDNNYDMFSLGEILTNKDLWSKISLDRNYNVIFMKFGRFILPTCTTSEIEKNDNIVFLEDDLELENLIIDSTEKELYNALFDDNDDEGEGENNTREKNLEAFIDMLNGSLDCIKNLTENNFKYNPPNNLDNMILKAVMEYNNESHGELIDYLKRKSQSFSIMNTEKDVINIILPKPYYTKNQDSEIMTAQLNSLLKQYDVFRPYPEINYRITFANYKDVEISSERLFGLEENNNLALQDNEKMFYNGLCDYIFESCKLYCKAKNMEDQLEHVIENVAIKDTPLESVLQYLIRIFVNKNWSMSPEVPVNEFSGVEESDDESDSNQAMDRLAYALEDKFSSGKNYHIDYYQTIYEMIMKNNCTVYAYAEAIIKLARWGSRKPTALVLNFDKSKSNNKLELDLFKMRTSYSTGSIECCKLGDKDYILSGILVSGDYPIRVELQDSIRNYLGVENMSMIPKNSIIGVQLVQVIKINDVEKHRLILMDLMTLMSNIDKVGGIYLDTDKGEVVFEEGFDYEKVASNILHLQDVAAYSESTNKTLMKLENINELYLGMYNFDKGTLKLLNMFNYTSILAQMGNANLFVQKTPMSKAFRAISGIIMGYYSDLEDLDKHGESIEIGTALTAFYYRYKDGIEALKSYHIQEENKEEKMGASGKTELFSQEKPEVVPMHYFKIVRDYAFYTVKTEEATRNKCALELFSLGKDDSNVKVESAKARPGALESMHNILVLCGDVHFKNRIYLNEKTREAIVNMVKDLYGTTDVAKVDEAIKRKIAAKRNSK